MLIELTIDMLCIDNLHRETKDVDIVNVEISGLHASPVEVAALMTEENTFIQGVARDVIRIFDITSDQMRSLVASFYKGNVLSDSYVALWKLSNEFYKIRVYDSTCGNFGSNATFDMNLKVREETPMLQHTCDHQSVTIVTTLINLFSCTPVTRSRRAHNLESKPIQLSPGET